MLPSYETPLPIIGIIKLEQHASEYSLYPGLYPVIYFEERCVQIPIYQNDTPDFIYIQREHIDEWIKFNDRQTKHGSS